MNYKQTIQFLFNRLPMYQKLGTKALKKDLTNIKMLSATLQNPQNNYPIIHIAGTNGKGTTAHMVSAIFQKAGFKVGLYSSPHYEDFRERIKVNGQFISSDAVVSFVAKIKKALNNIPASFFELTVAMAFDHFSSANVDLAIIETGLGGRLDSTNIVNPLLSVITNISLDHQKVLGNDHYSIAREKAGIIKHEKPVVIGRYQPSCDQVFFNVSNAQNSSLSFASLEWNIERGHQSLICTKNATVVTIKTDEVSPFHIENVTTALETIDVYNQHEKPLISKRHIEEGIGSFRKTSNYRGRWIVFDEDPMVIIDSAHNIEAISSVLNHLKSYSATNIHFVLGFVKDKDLQKILNLFGSNHLYYFTSPSISRGLPVGELKAQAIQNGLHGNSHETVGGAIKDAQSQAQQGDVIFIGGSSFVVADALEFFNQQSNI